MWVINVNTLINGKKRHIMVKENSINEVQFAFKKPNSYSFYMLYKSRVYPLLTMHTARYYLKYQHFLHYTTMYMFDNLIRKEKLQRAFKQEKKVFFM